MLHPAAPSRAACSSARPAGLRADSKRKRRDERMALTTPRRCANVLRKDVCGARPAWELRFVEAGEQEGRSLLEKVLSS